MFDNKDYIRKKIEIDCTKYMKNLFGDEAVLSATTSMEYYDTPEHIEEQENFIKNCFEESLNTSSIDFDYIGDLEVTFASGKTLKFWVSEWGGVKLKNSEDGE